VSATLPVGRCFAPVGLGLIRHPLPWPSDRNVKQMRIGGSERRASSCGQVRITCDEARAPPSRRTMPIQGPSIPTRSGPRAGFKREDRRELAALTATQRCVRAHEVALNVHNWQRRVVKGTPSTPSRGSPLWRLGLFWVGWRGLGWVLCRAIPRQR